MENFSILHVSNLYNPRPEDIEGFIKLGFLKLGANHFLPIDLRKVAFQHQMSLATATCLTVYISHKRATGQESLLTCLVMPQGANPRKHQQAYTIATLLIEKPRAK